MVSQAQNFIIIGDAVIIELMARLYKGSGTKKLSVGEHSFSANFRLPFSAGFCKSFSGIPYVNVSWSSTSCRGRQQCALNKKREVIVEKYQTVNHGAKIIAGAGVIQYWLIPIDKQVNRWLFFFSKELCEAQTNLINPETGIKVDFICD